MNANTTLDNQINRVGFWSGIIAIVTAIFAIFFPLDAPGGYLAEHADRIVWLNENRGDFIAGWINQIVAMLSLSGMFFGIAWRVATNNPISAILAAMVVLMSVMAFIIPKFIAVWTIPMLADTITNGAVGAELADPLLRLLNVSVPFSLYQSFDYLGFWLYSVFALLVAVPLYGQAMTAKISSVSLGLFGILYQLMLVALLVGEIAPEEIGDYFAVVSVPLLLAIVVMIFNFKNAVTTES